MNKPRKPCCNVLVSEQRDSKQRPENLRQRDKEGKDPDAYDKMNALGLARLEVSLSGCLTLL